MNFTILMDSELKSVNKIKLTLQVITVYAAIALGFTFPIATAPDTLLLVIILTGGILSGLFWHERWIIFNNPIAIFTLLLLSLLVIACFYSIGQPADSLKILNKYSHLLLIPLLLAIFTEEKYRRYGLNAFLLAMTLTLILSYLIFFGVFEGTRFFVDRLPSNPVVFKLHITHGIFMALSAYIFAIKSIKGSGKWRFIFMGLAFLASFNVLFMVQGRTGYVVFFALAIYLATHFLGRKGILMGVIGILMLALVGYLISANLHDRVDLAAHEYHQWQPEKGHDESSSIGTRMDFYTNTLKIIEKHPIFGVGTGGFEQAYQEVIVGTALAPSKNPHNQYLLFSAQIGLIGLAAFLLLLTMQWKLARKLLSEEHILFARGLVITIATGCLFNSLLLDHAEGLLFAWASGLLFSGLNNSRINQSKFETT